MGKSPQDPGQVLVVVMPSQHQKEGLARQIKGTELCLIKAQRNGDQFAVGNPQPMVDLPGCGLRVAEHPLGLMKHEGDIGQMVGQQRFQPGETQGNQVVGQHDGAHPLLQKGGFR